MRERHREKESERGRRRGGGMYLSSRKGLLTSALPTACEGKHMRDKRSFHTDNSRAMERASSWMKTGGIKAEEDEAGLDEKSNLFHSDEAGALCVAPVAAAVRAPVKESDRHTQREREREEREETRRESGRRGREVVGKIMSETFSSAAAANKVTPSIHRANQALLLPAGALSTNHRKKLALHNARVCFRCSSVARRALSSAQLALIVMVVLDGKRSWLSVTVWFKTRDSVRTWTHRQSCKWTVPTHCTHRRALKRATLHVQLKSMWKATALSEIELKRL